MAPEISTTRADGHWLTAARLTIYPRIFLAVFAVVLAAVLFQSQGLIDSAGQPLGYDFMAYWGASYLALQGEAAQAFDIVRITAAGQTGVPGFTSLHPWFYPPMFQLLIAPLALLPYGLSLLVWTIATLTAFSVVVRRIAPAPQTLWLTLAFPAVYLNIIHGQNGFLIASLFGGALLLLDRRPVLAGVLIGLLCFKPHFGILIPLALACGGRWTTFAAASVTTIAFVLTSTIILGPETWVGVRGNSTLVFRLLEEGVLHWEKMPTLFTALRLLGIGLPLAYTMHALLALGVAATVAWVWWKKAPVRLGSAVLVSGSLMISPYVFDYDLTLMAIPIALLAWDGHHRGWLAGEREILVAAWLLPILAPPIATFTGVQIGILGLGALFFMAVRRAVLSIDDPGRSD